MKTLFTKELRTKLSRREKEIAEGKGITVKRLEKLPSELRRVRTRTPKLSARKQPTNAAASDKIEAAV